MTETINVENRVVFLRGFKTILRPVDKKTDLEFFVKTMNDPEVAKFLAHRKPCTRGDEEKWFDNLSNRKDDIILAIEDIEKPGIIIGDMGIHQIDWMSRIATTGAVIGDKNYWGKGYGSDAKMVFLDYAFNELNLRKICSRVIGFNGRSVAYSKKCGYHEEGRLKEHHFRSGQYWDEILLSVFCEDWLPIWEYFKSHKGEFPPKS